MKWVTVDKKYYFLQDAASGRLSSETAEGEEEYVRAWLANIDDGGDEPGSPDLDPTRVEFTGPAARDAASAMLDAWCRLHEGRAYEVTYRTPGVLYLITPRLRMNLPSSDIRRIVLEAATESPTLLVDTKSAVIMLGMDSTELSLIPSDSDPQP